MKSLLVILLAITAGSTFAMSTVDFSKSSYSCNGMKITPQTTEATLVANCKKAQVVVHEQVVSGRNPNRISGGGADITAPTDDTDATLEKVKFYADDNSPMACYYRNTNFIKCKAGAAKKPAIQASTPKASSKPSSN